MMEAPTLWKRHSYPTQTCPSAIPMQRSNDKTHIAGPTIPQVPRDIRAVKDDESSKQCGRTIVVCLDGTGDKFDGDNSSIVHLLSCLKKSNPNQVSYYQSGIGTYDGGGLSNGFRAGMDMAVGSGLGVHIKDAYRFLMQNYQENDRICLFGFSRGAYTARCLAGMVHKVGLLPANNESQVDFAYAYYKDDTAKGWKMSADFKKTFGMNVNVHFVGVFDSVASVGFIPRKLPLSSTPTNRSSYFRHALALDERRAKFKACRYQEKDATGWKIVAEESESELSTASTRRDGIKTSIPKTDALEVWFAGAHADVGGGAVPNDERHKLSQIPLRWMIRQCFECDTGIIFKAHRLAEEGLDVHMLWPQYTRLEEPRFGPPPSVISKKEDGGLKPISHRSSIMESGTDEKASHELFSVDVHHEKALASGWIPEQVEDYFDALSPVNDQLRIAKGWWVLECWPIKVRIQPDSEDTWIKKVRMNLGRYRPVQEPEPNLHWTVKQKMATSEYRIGTRVDRNANWQVVV